MKKAFQPRDVDVFMYSTVVISDGFGVRVKRFRIPRVFIALSEDRSTPFNVNIVCQSDFTDASQAACAMD